MIQIYPITDYIDGEKVSYTAIEVELPLTKLLIVMTERGYIMCGALDVALLNERLTDRRIIAGRAVGVKTIQQLLEAPLESITLEAEQIGIQVGMSGYDALRLMR